MKREGKGTTAAHRGATAPRGRGAKPKDYYSDVVNKYADDTKVVMDLLSLDFSSPLRRAVSDHYGDLLRRAQLCRVMVPERVRALYPILRDLVDEITEIENENRTFEARERAKADRAVKRAQKLLAKHQPDRSGSGAGA